MNSLIRARAVGLLFLVLATGLLTACQPTGEAELQATLASLATESARQAGLLEAQGTMISYLATRGPFAITPLRPGVTPTPYRPVLGSALIEDGRCCVGGKAGDTIQIEVVLEASSPLGEVTEMRVGAGTLPLTEEELATRDWEPYAQLKSIPWTVAINWVGVYVTVQFRDSQGNLSLPTYDDISVEGMP